MRRVVVTGLGALTPLGNNLSEFWEGLKNGRSGSVMITRFNTEKFKTKFACELKGYDYSNYFDRKEANKLDLYSQYALVAAAEAINDSGINLDKVDKDRVGVIWASGIGGLDTFYQSIKDYVEGDGTPRFSPFFIPKMISDIAAGVISIKYGFRGPNFSTVSACASSTNSIIDAINYIRWGKADIFVTGGSEAAVNEPGIGGFNALQAFRQIMPSLKLLPDPLIKPATVSCLVKVQEPLLLKPMSMQLPGVQGSMQSLLAQE